jgi:hypothetical protein
MQPLSSHKALLACGILASLTCVVTDIRASLWYPVANAVNTVVLWNVFPLHMRGLAPTFTDAMHLVLAVNPFVVLSIVFGIVAFKGSFRVYSAVTVLLVDDRASAARRSVA